MAATLLAGCGPSVPSPAAISTPDGAEEIPGPPDAHAIRRGPGPGKPVPGDWFFFNLMGDARTLNPLILNDAKSYTVTYLIYEGLIDVDSEMHLVPRLATAWSFSEDKRVLLFKLRHSVRWQDGTPFTAEDVKFTYEAAMAAPVPNSWRALQAPVAAIQVLDPLSVEVTYNEPLAPALQGWRMPIVPRHRFQAAPYENSRDPTAFLGTGPYRVQSWEENGTIVLTANPDYWGGKPHLQRVVFKSIPSHTIGLQALQAGKIDATQLSSTQWDKQTAGEAFEDRFQRLRIPSLNFQYVGWNCAGKLFGDRAVRQAMTSALPRGQIISELLGGLAEQVTGPFYPGSWAYNRELAPRPFDLAEARRLLEEAGWRDHDGDGILDREGRPFRFAFLLRTAERAQEQVATLFKYNLEKLGVVMDVTALEYTTLVERVSRRDFEAYLAGWLISPDPDVYGIFHSSEIASGANFVGYANPEVDRLLVEARSTFDRAERARLYHRLHAVLHDEQPYTFLYSTPTLYALSRRFRNVQVTPFELFLYYPGLLQWWVPVEEQVYREE